VVGTVYSEDSLRAAEALGEPPAAPDLLELRVDHFARDPQVLDPLAAASARPLIVTVRHPAEGGQGDLGADRRLALYERFLPRAHYVDLELDSLEELAAVAGQAHRTPGGLIASHHDFRGTPPIGRLYELAGRAAAAGAALFKLAAQVERAGQMTVLLEFLATETRLPLAVMGMGPLGRVARLAAAALGSRLNYGYLGDVAQLPGQWPAAVLRARMDELCPGDAGPAAAA
jgi:3-dehydroquinate dehydratase-1